MERLNKLLAHAGVGSRRHCDALIAAGRVKVDGVPVRELGLRVNPEAQSIAVDDVTVKGERTVYWLVHKPRGYLCTNRDPGGRPTALDLIPHVEQRVYTVGRLDEDSEGLLLMTNDGDLAFKLMHPRFGVYKTYLVLVAGKPTRDELQKLLDGIWLSDGHVKAKRGKRANEQGESRWREIVLPEGQNGGVGPMLAKVGHKVLGLKRTAVGPLRLDRLSKGKSRRLKPEEVEALPRACERRPRQKEERPEVEEARPRRDRPLRPGEDRKPGTRPVAPAERRGQDTRHDALY